MVLDRSAAIASSVTQSIAENKNFKEDLLLAKDNDGVFPLALLARADNMEDVWQYINSKYDGNDTEVFDRFNYDLLLFIACAADNYDLCNFFLTVNKDLQSNRNKLGSSILPLSK